MEKYNPFQGVYSKGSLSTQDYKMPDLKDTLDVFGAFSETAMQGKDAMNTAQRSERFSRQMQEAYESIMKGDIYDAFRTQEEKKNGKTQLGSTPDNYLGSTPIAPNMGKTIMRES
jgi:hypothetical protein